MGPSWVQSPDANFLSAQTTWSRMTDAYIYLLKVVLELAPTDQRSNILTTRTPGALHPYFFLHMWTNIYHVFYSINWGVFFFIQVRVANMAGTTEAPSPFTSKILPLLKAKSNYTARMQEVELFNEVRVFCSLVLCSSNDSVYVNIFRLDIFVS